MRSHRYLLLATLFAALACSGDGHSITPPPDPGPTVLLKDIVIPNLPSPFYHFEYDGTGRITLASFASDLNVYNLSYADGRLSEMRNNILVNKDRLAYVYDDGGRVAEVRISDQTGVLRTRHQLTYAGQRLVRMDRYRLSNATFILDQSLSMSYDANGNLLELTEHLPAIEGLQDDVTFVDRFEQYDTGTNVDGFSLLHPGFFDHLVLLPTVQLQKGNPRKQTRTGNVDNFTVDYTYTYDAQNRPVTKVGDLTFVTGSHSGEHFQTNSLFSYY